MAFSPTSSAKDAGRDRIRRKGMGRRAPLAVAVLIAFGFLAAAAEYAVFLLPLSEASTGATTQAVFSGEMADGVPVYRLPAITVVARRGAESAR